MAEPRVGDAQTPTVAFAGAPGNITGDKAAAGLHGLMPELPALRSMRETLAVQESTLSLLANSSTSLQRFDETADLLLPAISNAFVTHHQVLLDLKKQIASLELRVISAKERASRIAVHHGLDPEKIAPCRILEE